MNKITRKDLVSSTCSWMKYNIIVIKIYYKKGLCRPTSHMSPFKKLCLTLFICDSQYKAKARKGDFFVNTSYHCSCLLDCCALLDHLHFFFSVLDEADRILDLGFATTLNAIIENLPEERQTMLYSATQTRYMYEML